MKNVENILREMKRKMILAKCSDAYTDSYKKGYGQAFEDLAREVEKLAKEEDYLLFY